MHKTKSGRPISITTKLNIANDQRGWQDDLLEATVDGMPAGHIRLSYIPQRNFDTFYPSVISYSAIIDGRGYVPAENQRTHPRDWPEEVQDRILYYAETDRDVPREMTNRFRENKLTMSKSDLVDELAKDHQHFNTKIWQDYLNFKDFHVEKALVAYIHVFCETDEKGLGVDWRRQHIAMALYQAARAHANSLGMDLWGSGLQQPEAKAAWDKMESLGWVEWRGTRRVLIGGPNEVSRANIQEASFC